MKKVLIAEDDQILSMRLVRTLEKHGDVLDVIAVINGKVAMDVLKDTHTGRSRCRQFWKLSFGWRKY